MKTVEWVAGVATVALLVTAVRLKEYKAAEEAAAAHKAANTTGTPMVGSQIDPTLDTPVIGQAASTALTAGVRSANHPAIPANPSPEGTMPATSLATGQVAQIESAITADLINLQAAVHNRMNPVGVTPPSVAAKAST